jgi:hypothetical protein
VQDNPRAHRECWRRVESVAPTSRILGIPEAARLLALYRSAIPDAYEPLVALMHAAGGAGRAYVDRGHLSPMVRELVFHGVTARDLADLRDGAAVPVRDALLSWRRMGDRSMSMSRSVFLAHAVLLHGSGRFGEILSLLCLRFGFWFSVVVFFFFGGGGGVFLGGLLLTWI